MSDEMVRFAVPKKGRMYEQIVEILKGIGLEFTRKPRLDIALCKYFPCELVFLPCKDIPTFVAGGEIDLGISGQDMIAESTEADGMLNEIAQLQIGKCRLCLQAPVANNITSAQQLIGKSICTSFVNITRKYFEKLEGTSEITTRIKFISGSVEAACALGIADAVIDLVETGTSMRAAGLEIVEEILPTQAVLMQNKNIPEKHKVLVQRLVQRIAGYQAAQAFSVIKYNISNALLEEAKKITPGQKSPDITPLGEEGYFSVGAMVENSSIQNVMDKLQDLGATDIFVMKIANCRVDNFKA